MYVVTVNKPGFLQCNDGDLDRHDTLADARLRLAEELVVTADGVEWNDDQGVLDAACFAAATAEPEQTVMFLGFAHTINEGF